MEIPKTGYQEGGDFKINGVCCWVNRKYPDTFELSDCPSLNAYWANTIQVTPAYNAKAFLWFKDSRTNRMYNARIGSFAQALTLAVSIFSEGC